MLQAINQQQYHAACPSGQPTPIAVASCVLLLNSPTSTVHHSNAPLLARRFAVAGTLSAPKPPVRTSTQTRPSRPPARHRFPHPLHPRPSPTARPRPRPRLRRCRSCRRLPQANGLQLLLHLLPRAHGRVPPLHCARLLREVRQGLQQRVAGHVWWAESQRESGGGKSYS